MELPVDLQIPAQRYGARRNFVNTWSHFARTYRGMADIGRTWPKLARFGPSLDRVGQTSSSLAPERKHLTRFRPIFGLSPTDSACNRPTWSRHRSNFDHVRLQFTLFVGDTPEYSWVPPFAHASTNSPASSSFRAQAEHDGSGPRNNLEAKAATRVVRMIRRFGRLPCARRSRQQDGSSGPQ